MLGRFTTTMYYAYNQAGKDLGPFSTEKLRELLNSGEFPADKLVRAETSKDGWQPLSTALGITPPPTVSPGADSAALSSADAVSRAVISRYRNAYLVARATTAIGASVKFIGISLGVLIVLAAVIFGGQTERTAQGLVVGLFLGAVVAIPLFVLGVLVSAHGEVLKATLDSAVHGSPFLKKEDMARVMSL